MSFRAEILDASDKRAKPIKRCADCGCGIASRRAMRCGPCRDIADETRRRVAYLEKKAARQQSTSTHEAR